MWYKYLAVLCLLTLSLTPSFSHAGENVPQTLCESDVTVWDLSAGPPYITQYAVVATITTPTGSYPLPKITENLVFARDVAVEAIAEGLWNIPNVAENCSAAVIATTGKSNAFDAYPGSVKVNVPFPKIIITAED